MKIKRQKVNYQFYTFQSGVTGVSNNTLVIDSPASLKFILSGNGGANDFAIINNNFTLEPIGKWLSSTSTHPYELIFDNNLNEVDITTYQIFMSSPANAITLTVIAKFFVND
jgi:hypothetical protein